MWANGHEDHLASRLPNAKDFLLTATTRLDDGCLSVSPQVLRPLPSGEGGPVMQLARLGALSAVLSLALLTTTARAQVPDHLKCYKVKDPLKLGGTADLDTPQFGADAGCKISK